MTLEDGAARGAIVLMAHGTPRSLDEIEPFLSVVRGGRETPPEVVEEVRRRYAAIGGRSPLTEITREQARALEERLGVPVVVGMRAWHPFVREAVAEALARGARRIVGLALAPQRSSVSVGAYEAALREACHDLAREGEVTVTMVGSWCREPALLDALADGAARVLARLAPELREGAELLLTAHSIPLRLAEGGDLYPGEVAATAEGVLARLGRAGRGRVVYQSRGMTEEPWLGPDLGEALGAAARAGAKGVVVAPVGFVAEHVETLHDLDIEARALAEELGLRFERAPAPGASARLVDALEAVARRALAESGA